MPATDLGPLVARARRRLRGVVGRARRVAARRRGGRLVLPEVVAERTNLGPAMDDLVTLAKRRQEPLGVDRDYDLLRDHFDHLNFLLDAQTARFLPSVDPIRLFLSQGAEAVHSPDHHFSMANYLARYPDKVDGAEASPYLEWIKRGQDAGEIADPAYGIESMARMLGLETEDVVRELVATRSDMMQRLRTGELGRMFAKAAEVDPLIGAVWCETARTRLLPMGGLHVVGQTAAIHASQTQAGFRRARVLVVTDRPRFGMGRTFVSDLASGLTGTIEPDDLVVVYTDGGSLTRQPPPLPAGVREVDFAAAAAGLPEEHRLQSLTSLLRSFGADSIVNVGSRTLYKALTPYGKALAASERIFLVFISNEQHPTGHWQGAALDWFYSGMGIVTGFITDSEYFRDEISEMYQVGDPERARIHVFRSPADTDIAPVPAPAVEPSRRPVVHWVGRGDRRGRMDIALQIARRMPEVDFRFWNAGLLQGPPAAPLPANVRMEGLGGRITDLDLDLSTADAWLYTWAWEVLPPCSWTWR